MLVLENLVSKLEQVHALLELVQECMLLEAVLQWELEQECMLLGVGTPFRRIQGRVVVRTVLPFALGDSEVEQSEVPLALMNHPECRRVENLVDQIVQKALVLLVSGS